MQFLVSPSDNIYTGLFLDHRKTRSIVRSEAKGKSFLNLFACTGSYSVYAAAGGAASTTTTVDWSNTYLAWAQETLRLNGIADDQRPFVRSDAMDPLRNSIPKAKMTWRSFSRQRIPTEQVQRTGTISTRAPRV